MTIDFKPNKKQWLAWEKLMDNETTHILYGGGAGGGKSYLACVWAIIYCLKYPGIRGLIGQAFLKQLKISTLKTFLELVKEWDLADQIKINDQKSIITFTNGSEIILKDLYLKPSDPEFGSLGGLELTFVIIDEASMVSRDAYEVLTYSRLRYKLLAYNLTPKTLITSNPAKNWLFDEFYLPWREGELNPTKIFIPAYASDNPYLDESYIKGMGNLSQNQRERLLKGNWEYGDESYNLFLHQDLLDCFHNNFSLPDDTPYLSVDVATTGKDKAVVCRWCGLSLEEFKVFNYNTAQELVDYIESLEKKYRITRSKVVVDTGGNNFGDLALKGCQKFISNSRPLHQENYNNLKSQCFFKLSQLVSAGKIQIKSTTHQDKICKELEAFKHHNFDKDTKLQITPKEQVKNYLGHSPDFAEAIAMRMYYELSATPPVKITKLKPAAKNRKIRR